MFTFLRSDLTHLQAYTPTHIASADLDRLDGNESPVDLPPELKQKLAWTYQELISANRYPDGGHAELKQAIATYVNTSAPSSSVQPTPTITPEQISVGNGSDELIRSLLIATCLGGGGSILVAEPTFSMYGILATTLGIPVCKISRHQENWQMDLEAAAQVIQTQATTDSPVRVVFVVHPNSPTANALTNQEIAWLRSLPEDILVVIDEAYFEFCQHSLVGELSQHSNWVILRTFSKAFRLAAHRVGYAIAHPQIIQALEKIRLPYNLPSFSQAAALIALQHSEALLASVSQILSDRQHLISHFRQQPALRVWESQANFIYLRLAESFGEATDHEQSLTHIRQGMEAQGTLIRQTGGGLRITVGSTAENQRTIDRLIKVL
jgi:histidinol-phosphate aminotransferase